MTFELQRLKIPEVFRIRIRAARDARGSLTEIYKASALRTAGIVATFVQANHTRSAARTLRGLHYQHPPWVQGKLIHVVQGEIFDVAVDLRVGSPTYAKWISGKLCGEIPESLYVPPGFAHGYCTLDRPADVVYLMTSEYSPEHEAGILWNDPRLGIPWPIADPVVSERDTRWPLLEDAENRFVYAAGNSDDALGRKRSDDGSDP